MTTKNEIKAIIEEQKIAFVRVMFTDVFGTIKNVEIPISQMNKLLDDKLMFDGSSIEGFVRIEESDMYLVPDLETFVVFPWSSEEAKVAGVIANIITPDGQPFAGDPRNNLIRNIEKMKDEGIDTFNIGPEPEFFLFKLDENGKPTTELNDEGGYFDLAPLDTGENVRREIILAMDKMGFDVEAGHHEVAPGQHEIDFKYADVLQAADKIQMFKLVVKTIARKHGYYATFMPKPFSGINGNGMHTNMSMFKDDKNLFEDEKDAIGLSQTARQFLAGVLAHAKALTALTNPTINSYKRLTPGFEAPVYVAWSASNRSPMIRIPASRGKSTRLELRMVDPTANPYAAFASILTAGLDGIKSKMTPVDPVNENIFEMSDDQRVKENIDYLPDSLAKAIESLENDEVILESLGERIVVPFVEAKKLEFSAYRQDVSQWELDHYLSQF